MSRETCQFKDRCGVTGHYREPTGAWVRCTCLEMEILRNRLGQFYTDTPSLLSPLVKQTDQCLLLEGPLSQLRKHVAGALIALDQKGKTFRSMDAYRLLEIYLEKDTEFQTTTAGTDADLLIFLLGFGDPRNRYLPELLLQAIDRRELLTKPTWVVLGCPAVMLAGRYNEALSQRLLSFRKVTVRE